MASTSDMTRLTLSVSLAASGPPLLAAEPSSRASYLRAKPPAALPKSSRHILIACTASPPSCSIEPVSGHDEYRLIVPLLVSEIWVIPGTPMVVEGAGMACWARAQEWARPRLATRVQG